LFSSLKPVICRRYPIDRLRPPSFDLKAMKTSFLVRVVCPLMLLAACSPEPVVEAPPAVEDRSQREEAEQAGREAAAAAREAVEKASEAVHKLGEAGAAAVQAAADAASERVLEETGRALEKTEGAREASADNVRDAKEAAEQAAQRIVDVTRGAAQKLKEVGKGAIDSVRAKPTEGEADADAPGQAQTDGVGGEVPSGPAQDQGAPTRD
jgi:hypothetical protein